jgi:hypothetical protein
VILASPILFSLIDHVGLDYIPEIVIEGCSCIFIPIHRHIFNLIQTRRIFLLPAGRKLPLYPAIIEKMRCFDTMLGGSHVTTKWRILGLRMELQLRAMEGSCEYIE